MSSGGFRLPSDSGRSLPGFLSLPFAPVSNNARPIGTGVPGGTPAPTAFKWDRAVTGGDMGWPADNSVPYHVPIRISKGGTREEDLGHDMFIFRYCDLRNARVGYGVHYKSLSALNYYLKSQEGRERYGRYVNAAAVLVDWALVGVQQTTPPDWSKGTDHVINFWMGLRVLMPNIWLAFDANANRCSKVFLVLRRMLYEPLDGAASATAAEYYWCIEPFSNISGEAPPMALMNSGEGFGHYWYVGVATKVYGNYQQPKRYMETAEKAVFPLTSDDSFRQHYYDLPTIEIQVGIR